MTEPIIIDCSTCCQACTVQDPENVCKGWRNGAGQTMEQVWLGALHVSDEANLGLHGRGWMIGIKIK